MIATLSRLGFIIPFRQTQSCFPGGDTVTLSNASLGLFMSDESHSYKCHENVTVSLTGGKIFMANVQVQPFGVDKSDGSFSAGGISTETEIRMLQEVDLCDMALLS